MSTFTPTPDTVNILNQPVIDLMIEMYDRLKVRGSGSSYGYNRAINLLRKASIHVTTIEDCDSIGIKASGTVAIFIVEAAHGEVPADLLRERNKILY